MDSYQELFFMDCLTPNMNILWPFENIMHYSPSDIASQPKRLKSSVLLLKFFMSSSKSIILKNPSFGLN